MRLTAHIPQDLKDRFDRFIKKHYGGRHGAISIVVEKALNEFLDREESRKP